MGDMTPEDKALGRIACGCSTNVLRYVIQHPNSKLGDVCRGIGYEGDVERSLVERELEILIEGNILTPELNLTRKYEWFRDAFLGGTVYGARMEKRSD